MQRERRIFYTVFTTRRPIRHSGFTPRSPILSGDFKPSRKGKIDMLDLIYIGVALGSFGLFALAIGACERL